MLLGSKFGFTTVSGLPKENLYAWFDSRSMEGIQSSSWRNLTDEPITASGYSVNFTDNGAEFAGTGRMTLYKSGSSQAFVNGLGNDYTFSISFYAPKTQLTDTYRGLFGYHPGNPGIVGWQTDPPSLGENTISFGFYYHQAGWDSSFDTPATLSEDGWNYLTISHGPTGIKCFRAGVKIKDVPNNTGNPDVFTPSSSYFYLGSAYTSGRYFKGKIGDLMIWNRTLTDEECVNVYKHQKNLYK